MNKLQVDVNGWIKEIEKVTASKHDPSKGTAIQEINFWLSMEEALEGIEEKLKSDEIGMIFIMITAFLEKPFDHSKKLDCDINY